MPYILSEISLYCACHTVPHHALRVLSNPLINQHDGGFTMADKKADLAGPGIGDYDELKKILPNDYRSLLDPKETQKAIFEVKNYIEKNLCKELNLMMVQVPLIVDVESGVNDFLDRDGSRTPIQFHINNDYNKHPIDAQVVQAATKWKRVALGEFGMKPGEGLCTDMRAVRKDYFLDHDHSCYVDQWDWERAITAADSEPRFPEGHRQEDLEGPQGRRAARPGALPEAEDEQVPEPPGRARLPARRGDPRHVPRPAAQAARDADPPEVSRGVHHRHRLGPEGRLSPRDARGRLRRLGDTDDVRERETDARPQRRHPGLEPRHEAAARAHLDGDPRERRDAAAAARDHQAARLPEAPLPPGDHQRTSCR